MVTYLLFALGFVFLIKGLNVAHNISIRTPGRKFSAFHASPESFDQPVMNWGHFFEMPKGII